MAQRVFRRGVATSSFFSNARHYFLLKPAPPEPPNPYIQYPVVTSEQMRRINNDRFKLDCGYASWAYHSTSLDPSVSSLSDLTDPTLLNTLLPRRRPHGSPADTLLVKAGDDAMLVSPSVMAIADGVSGWESKGEQCLLGVWARLMVETLSRLMTEYKVQHAPHHLNKRDIDQILDDLYLHTLHLMDLQDMRGLLTLVLGMVSGEYLKMISIGDLKVYVIRDNEVVATNEEQLVLELCPQQIGTQTLGQLPLEMAWVHSVQLQENDIIVMCSDGISDNLYEWEIMHYVDEYLNLKKDSLRAAANRLLSRAKEVAFDDYAYTPYNELVNSLPEAKFGKTLSTGGKLDDMSLCIARVVPNKAGGVKVE